MKVLTVAGLEAHTHLVSFHSVVGLELLIITLAEKHMATVLPIFVLVRRRKII